MVTEYTRLGSGITCACMYMHVYEHVYTIQFLRHLSPAVSFCSCREGSLLLLVTFLWVGFIVPQLSYQNTVQLIIQFEICLLILTSCYGWDWQ